MNVTLVYISHNRAQCSFIEYFEYDINSKQHHCGLPQHISGNLRNTIGCIVILLTWKTLFSNKEVMYSYTLLINDIN